MTTKSKPVLEKRIEPKETGQEDLPFDMANTLEGSIYQSHEDPMLEDSSSFVESAPFEVYLRYEEDIAAAYREFYRDQVVNDKRNELGRFLFGVSFTTLGFIISLLTLTRPTFDIKGSEGIWLLSTGVVLILSALCSLRLAVPINQDVDPTTLELVELHRSNSIELSRLSAMWFTLWLIGFVLGVYMFVK